MPRLALNPFFAVLVICGFLSCPAADASAAELTAESAIFHDWLDQMDRRFEANPHLKTEPGGGWKPYNRIKWFNEERMIDGELPAPGARWEVWEYKRDLERTHASSARSTWFSLGPTNFAGRMLSLAFEPGNPSVVYAGAADGGLWRSEDGGASWAPLTDELPTLAIGGVAVSPLDTDVIVIGTGEGTNNVDRVSGVGILRSTDRGATWNTTNVTYAVSGGSGFHFVHSHPTTGMMFAGEDSGLWSSTDSGASWDSVKVGGDYYDLVWKPDDSNVVYTVKGSAGSGNNVKKSTDGGVTFSKAGTGQPQSFSIGKSKLAVSADDPNTVYVMYTHLSDNDLLGVYRSTDVGETWTLRTASPNIPGAQGWYNLSLAADPSNVDIVIAGGVRMYRSTNGANSFFTSDSGVHVDHHVAAYEPGSNSNVWVGSDGGMWRSTNDGVTWTNRNNGLVTYQFYDICVAPDPQNYYIMGGTQDNGTDRWSGTTTWTNGLGADGMMCDVDFNGTTVYAEIQFGSHRRNLNSGVGGWTNINNGITGDGRWVTPTAHDYNRTGILYTGTDDGLFKTTNAGNSWTNVNASANPRFIHMSRVDGAYAWAVETPPIYTTDDGSTWNTASPYGFSAGGATMVLAHPTELNTAFVTFSGYADQAHIAMTTDLGATWTDVTGDFPDQPVNAIAVNPSSPDSWFIGTDVGVWCTNNGGVNWLPFETGFPNAVVDDLEIQDDLQKLVAGTHGRGAWEVDISSHGDPTSVEVGVAPAPRNLMLDPPSPNPARDRTLLRFAAKHAGRVTLKIYDVQGRVVAHLAEYGSGDGVIRTTPWFTDDVSSGVYFAVLSTSREQISHKIIVAK